MSAAASPAASAASLGAPTPAAPAAQTLTDITLTQHEPRAYGYFVGDVFERRIVIDAPAGSTLDADTLPKPQRQGQWLELRSLTHTMYDAGGRRTRELLLRHQVLLAPSAPRTLELAPFSLRVRDGARTADLRVEAWPISVAPLVPLEVAQRRGLGDAQPDAALPPVSERGHRMRMLVLTLLALPALALLAWAWWLGPWLQARQRPFHAAWRRISAARVEGLDDAYRALHHALDASHGQVLFAHELPRWLAARADAAPLADALRRFFVASEARFFGPGAGSTGVIGDARRPADAAPSPVPSLANGRGREDAAELEALRRLARGLRALERGGTP